MADIELIAPAKTVTVTFSLEPAHNVLSSLFLINEAEDTSGLHDWVYQTAAALSPDRQRHNRLVCHFFGAEALLDRHSWPGFPAWLDHLAAQEPTAMRDRILEDFIRHVARKLDSGEAIAIPTPAELLADRATYLALIERVYASKGGTPDLSLCETAHALFNDPPALKDLILTHLGWMWEAHLAAEWERNLPTLRETVAAFQQLDYAGLSLAGAIRRTVGREVPAAWEEWTGAIDHIIFLPSAHIGPYLLEMEGDETSARIVFGARLPGGVAARPSALSRTELQMRLSALADDTRLQILRLLAQEGELCAQDIMARLGLSQSAASRHLRQLSATGYVLERRRDGAKCYRLNRERMNDTLNALLHFLQE